MAKETIKLNISGMTCVNCSNGIEKAVNKLDGLESSKVSFASNEGAFFIDNKLLNKETLISKIKKLGYGVEEDLKALEKSTKYDFKTKDEDGKVAKVLPSGRPAFKGKVERFIWVLENPKQMNEKDKELMEKYPDLYEIAKSQVKVG